MKPKHIGLLILGVIVVFFGAVQAKYGTIAPCGVLRAKMRQQAAQQGGVVGFMSQVASDQMLNGILVAQYGELTTAKCFKLALEDKN